MLVAAHLDLSNHLTLSHFLRKTDEISSYFIDVKKMAFPAVFKSVSKNYCWHFSSGAEYKMISHYEFRGLSYRFLIRISWFPITDMHAFDMPGHNTHVLHSNYDI